MLEVTIHIPALERMADAIIAAGAAAGGAAVAAKPAPAPKDKPAPAEKVKPEPKAEEPAKPAPDAAAKRAEATKLLQKINQANGIDAVRAALAEFGVANISAIADDKLDEVIVNFSDKLA